MGGGGDCAADCGGVLRVLSAVWCGDTGREAGSEVQQYYSERGVVSQLS